MSVIAHDMEDLATLLYEHFIPLSSSSACSLWSVQRWSLRHSAAYSRGSQPLGAPCAAAEQAEMHHWNCGTIPGSTGEGNQSYFLIGWLWFFFFFFLHVEVRKSHLEQAEPARAELVLALTVLKREKFYELVYERWVWEMVKDDLLPLLGTRWK